VHLGLEVRGLLGGGIPLSGKVSCSNHTAIVMLRCSLGIGACLDELRHDLRMLGE
jgi:hypothetical protein